MGLLRDEVAKTFYPGLTRDHILIGAPQVSLDFSQGLNKAQTATIFKLKRTPTYNPYRGHNWAILCIIIITTNDERWLNEGGANAAL